MSIITIKQVFIIVFCTLILSSCSELIINNSKELECENWAKELVPESVSIREDIKSEKIFEKFRESGVELEKQAVDNIKRGDTYHLYYINWRDGSTFGKMGSNSQPRRAFYKGNKQGQNINYLYSVEANKYSVIADHITYFKEIIKDDIILGSNSFEIDNIVLRKKPNNTDGIENQAYEIISYDILNCNLIE